MQGSAFSRCHTCKKIEVKGGEGWVKGWIFPFTQLSTCLLDSYGERVKGEGIFRKLSSVQNETVIGKTLNI